MPAGAPTELNDELCLIIRDLVLIGKKEKEIIEIIAQQSENKIIIDIKTFEGWIWRNYKGFADKWRMYKQEWKLKKAEENIDEFLEMDTENTMLSKKGEKFDFDDPRLKKIKADITTFVAETLGKKDYSKRNELSGPGGEALFKWQDENDNHSILSQKMGESITPIIETMDSDGASSESGKDNGST